MRPCRALRHSSGIHRHRPRAIAHQWRPCSSRIAKQPNNDHDATKTHDAQSARGLHVNAEAKSVETAVGELPLSPVMDPLFWEARDRYKKKKPKPGAPQNVFEREFGKNAFAQALATPVRYDSVSRLRMPAFFLQDFNIMSHPETGEPWWVPRSLALRQSPTSTTTATDGGNIPSKVREEADLQQAPNIEQSAGAEAEEALLGPAAEPPAVAVASTQSGKVFGPSAYVLARQGLLKSFQEVRKAKKGFRTSIQDLGNAQFHRRMLGASNFRYVGGVAIWREDMDQFVLNQMRELIVQDLFYLSTMCQVHSRHYIVKCYGWDDIKFKHKGAVLWFEDDDIQPGPFATYDIGPEHGKTSLAVHNLPMLLGSELAEKLRKESALFENASICMLAGRRTTDLQLRLWKLQGYIYDFGRPT